MASLNKWTKYFKKNEEKINILTESETRYKESKLEKEVTPKKERYSQIDNSLITKEVQNKSDNKKNINVEEVLEYFERSQSSSLCLFADEQCSSEDYRMMIKRFKHKETVFLGSDRDICLTKKESKNIDVYIVDFTNIFQPDSLNFLIELQEDKKTKTIGIMSKERYRSSAESFQSRWQDYGNLKNRKHKEEMKIIASVKPEMNCIEIDPRFSIEIYVSKIINWSGGNTFCLMGAEIDSPVVKYLQAYLKENGGDVYFYRYPYPKSVVMIKDIPKDPEIKCVHTMNFETCINGEYYIEDESLKRKKSETKKICVIHELKEESWRYLGYLEETQGIKIMVLSSVKLPDEVSCVYENKTDKDSRLYIKPKEKIDIDMLFKNKETYWLVSRDSRLSEYIGDYVRKNPLRMVLHHIVVQPKDRLDDYLVKVCATDSQFSYQKSSSYEFFMNPNAVIVFENLECNPILSIELQYLSLSKVYSEGPKKMDIKSKLLCLSTQFPQLTGIKILPIKELEDVFINEHLPVKKELKMAEATTDDEKRKYIKDWLISSIEPFIVVGKPNTGKTHFLNEIMKSLSMKVFYLSCSSAQSQEEKEDIIQSWLQSKERATLVVDHFDEQAYGSWQFLIPDSKRMISLKGERYKLTESHRCVFVGHKEITPQQSLARKLNRICFYETKYEETGKEIETWSDKEQIVSWLKSCINQINHLSKKKMTILGCRYLYDLYTFFNNTLDLNQASQLKALSFFLKIQNIGLNVDTFKKCFSLTDKKWELLKNEIELDTTSQIWLTKDQIQIRELIKIFLGSYHLNGESDRIKKPILWIEGLAGSGKDFITEQVFKEQGVKSIRVRGVRLQSVIEKSKIAKRNGCILVIEEADFLPIDIVRSILDMTDAHPKYCVIATVNGCLYKGRRPILSKLAESAWVYICSRVTPDDLGQMLDSRYKDVISKSDRDYLMKEYEKAQISLSPREVFNIFETSMYSGQSLQTCWLDRIALLNDVRPKKIENKHTEIQYKERKQEEDLFLKKSELFKSLKWKSCSAMGAVPDEIRCIATTNMLPNKYFIEKKDGTQILCSGKGDRKYVSKHGKVCFEIPRLNGLLVECHGSEAWVILPLPASTQPIVIEFFDHTKTQKIKVESIYQDEHGLYFIKVKRSLIKSYKFIMVHYEVAKERDTEFEWKQIETGYETLELQLPEKMNAVVNREDISPEARLDQLSKIFEDEMEYDKSLRAKRLFKGATCGEKMVKQCLKLKIGCCYELAHTFYAIVRRYFGFPIRFVEGYKLCSTGEKFVGHLWVEVLINNYWKQYDVTSSYVVMEDNTLVNPSALKNIPNQENNEKESVFKRTWRSLADQQMNGLKRAFSSENVLFNQADGLFVGEIKKWCYATGHVQKKIKASVMHSLDKTGSLSLEMCYRTTMEVFESVEFNPENEYEPDLQVVLTKADKCSIDYVKALFDMHIPVFEAKTGEVNRVYDYNNICWEKLVLKEDIETPGKMVALCDILTSFREEETFHASEMDTHFFDTIGEKISMIRLDLGDDIEVIDKITDYFLKMKKNKQKRLYQIKSLDLRGFGEDSEKKLGQLIDLLRPSLIVLKNDVFPLFSYEISGLAVKGVVNNHVRFKNYLNTRSCFKKLETLSIEFTNKSELDDVIRGFPYPFTRIKYGLPVCPENVSQEKQFKMLELRSFMVDYGYYIRMNFDDISRVDKTLKLEVKY